MKKIILGIVACILLVAGFIFIVNGSPTIDTSSDEAMKASIGKVKSSLPEDRRDDFEDAIKIVAFSGFDFSDLLQSSQVDPGATERKIKESLDGKTGEEVIALAEQINENREKERLKKEKGQREKAIQIIFLAEELRKEGDYERALSRYEEVMIYDSDNVGIKGRIAKLKRIIEEKREDDQSKQRKIRELLAEARELEKDKGLLRALSKYQEALALDGDSESALAGIKETKEKIGEFKEKQLYLSKVNLYDFEAATIDTYLEKDIPAVKFKIKNGGDKTLTEVKVTVYLKDADGNIIYETDFHPVLVSSIRSVGTINL